MANSEGLGSEFPFYLEKVHRICGYEVTRRLVTPADIAEAKKCLEGNGTGVPDMLRYIQWFIAHVECGAPIEKGVLEIISEAFQRVLVGSKWEDEFPLPWIEHHQTKRELDTHRNGEMLYGIWEAVAYENKTVEEALHDAADQFHLAYETVRGIYRKSSWPARLRNFKKSPST